MIKNGTLMEKIDKNFQVDKKFGIGVLLKLTKYSVENIKISTEGNKFISNVSLEKLSAAVDSTLKTHNIKLKCR